MKAGNLGSRTHPDIIFQNLQTLGIMLGCLARWKGVFNMPCLHTYTLYSRLSMCMGAYIMFLFSVSFRQFMWHWEKFKFCIASSMYASFNQGMIYV